MTGTLMGLQPQYCIQRRHGLSATALGTPSYPPALTDRAKEARHLALHEAFTAQVRSTHGAAGPKRWAQGALGQHGFEDVKSQDASQWPNG